MRVSYSAPRFLRDCLRTPSEGEELANVRWLQPMMEALAPTPSLPQDLTSCPVSLMPERPSDGGTRILLNFQVTLEAEALFHQLGRKLSWMDQLCWTKEYPHA